MMQSLTTALLYIFLLFSSLTHAADPMRGVNIGGVFLVEPFIAPSLFDQFTNLNDSDRPVDEWTFCKALGKDEAKRQLEDHWSTFVTKDHLEKLAQYGINWIRIPMGYWAFNVTDAEPFVDGQIPYIERLLGWARDTGLSVQLDLHGAPGSQNGYDNSGKRGDPTWLDTRDNVDRTLDAFEKMTELAVKWKDTVKAVHAINEPSNWKWPTTELYKYVESAYRILRSKSETMTFVYHDAFMPPKEWYTITNKKWTNAIIDSHIYQIFDTWLVTFNESAHLQFVEDLMKDIFTEQKVNGTVPSVGEFSAATHDCTKYINGLGRGSRWEGTLEDIDGPLCPFKKCTCSGDYGGDYRKFSDKYKRFMKRYIDAQLEQYEKTAGWFYWNFRTESAPEWDYLLGVEQGWIKKFPRTAVSKTKGSSDRKQDEKPERDDSSSACRGASGIALLACLISLTMVVL